MKLIIAAALLLTAAPGAVLAQEKAGDVYTVGELQITAQDRSGQALGGAVIDGETIRTYNKQTVDQLLALVPGANGGNTGGSRNERVIYIRGFDRFQTTISVDGVRVFLPVDNRIDFARFLTADLSEVQISKGYVSVLDGPGGLGGAINLVTSKPTRSLEGDIAGSSFIGRDGDMEAYQASARLGGKTGQFYWQVSGVINDRDHFTLSDDFTPTAFENGGERDHSASRDWRVNAKLGFQPNDTDEYSLNFIKSEGEKSAPDHVSNSANARYWEWPVWNMDSLALLTRTRLADGLTLKSRLYTNGWDNLLVGYDTAARTVQSLPRSFFSYYEEKATGGNVELNYDVNDNSQLKGVFYVRKDVHKERQDGYVRTSSTPTVNAPYSEPWQTSDEITYSAAAQYSTGLGDNFDLTIGASYDWTDLRQADDFTVSAVGTTIPTAVVTLTPVSYPLEDRDAFNGQAALAWRVSDATRVHVSVSSRARFPTLFERFSARFGTAVPNPGLKPERSTNYEIGGDAQIDKWKLSGAVFYSDLQDALVLVNVTLPAPIGATTQTKNLGKGRYYGFEASAELALSDTLTLGGNYTYLQRDLVDTTNPAFRPTGTPNSKAFLYANWSPTPKLTVRPNVEYASNRWLSTPDTLVRYYKGGEYWLANISADYALTDRITATVAVQNLADSNYQLQDGFPEGGRSFYASLRARF